VNSDLPERPGLHDRELELPSGRCVRCTLAVPAGISRGAPLVLCLHYGGEPRGYYGRPLLEQLLLPAWRALGAVMLAPVSAGGDWTTPDNTSNALEVASFVEQAYACAANRRIVAGYSLGAIGAWHLLSHAPAHFAAAVPMAGPPPLAEPGVTPVRALNSTADRLFPSAATVAALEDLRERGADAACTLIQGVEHHDFGGFSAALASLLPWLCERLALSSAAR
jgi:predicted peptidase